MTTMLETLQYLESEVDRLMGLDDRGLLCGHGVTKLIGVLAELKIARKSRNREVLRALSYHLY